MSAVKTQADREALTTFDTLPDSAFVRVSVVATLFSVSTVSIWAWTKQGRIPQPRRFGRNATVWNVGELRRVMMAEAV
tara:strand:- start:50 stop:283 length:234 start_codon:yes stop_codon:yes gene_type:complete